VTEAAMDFNCETCDRHGKQMPHNQVSAPVRAEFNHKLFIDDMYLENQPILHIICAFTRFTMACILASLKSIIIVKKL